MRFWNAQKGGRRWITFILTFQTSTSSIRLPLPVSFWKKYNYGSKPSRDNLQIAAPNSNASQKSSMSRIQQTMFMLLYALFVSFPLRHEYNIRYDGRHCIGDTYTHIPWFGTFYTVDLIDKVLSTWSFRRKQTISHIKRTIRTHFC